jgi:hypothetical protein
MIALDSPQSLDPKFRLFDCGGGPIHAAICHDKFLIGVANEECLILCPPTILTQPPDLW